MRGTMVWFNEEKGHGYISTETGERLYVSEQASVDGNRAEGRCAGLPVEFDVATTGETPPKRSAAFSSKRTRLRALVGATEPAASASSPPAGILTR